MIGTNTSGCTPSVVPSNPRGATPTIVIVWPLTIMRLVQRTGIGREPRLPVRVAEDDDVRLVDGAIVLGRQETADCRLQVEDGEIAA